MNLRIVISCVFLSAIFSSTMTSSCDNIIRMEDLQNTIKNQTIQSEVQTRVIEEQRQLNEGLRNILEDQRSMIENQTKAIHDLKNVMEHTEIGVYFTVGLSKDTAFREQKIIQFNKIITNVGGGYIDDYGKFIAPQNGTYQFSASFFSRDKVMRGDLMQNGQLVIVANNGGDGPCSLSVIFDLKEGDEVYLMRPQRMPDNAIYDDSTTSFSGFLIYPGT